MAPATLKKVYKTIPEMTLRTPPLIRPGPRMSGLEGFHCILVRSKANDSTSLQIYRHCCSLRSEYYGCCWVGGIPCSWCVQ
jgi:hypothetical protein